jgi:hypothetical protein
VGWGQRGTSQGLAEGLFECGHQFGPGRARGRLPGDHNVGTSSHGDTMSAEMVAQYAFDAVADHRAGTDLARHREAEARFALIAEIVHREDRRGGTAAACENRVEFRTRAYPRGARVAGCATCNAIHTDWISANWIDAGMPGIHERRPFMPEASCLWLRIGSDWRIAGRRTETIRQ